MFGQEEKALSAIVVQLGRERSPSAVLLNAASGIVANCSMPFTSLRLEQPLKAELPIVVQFEISIDLSFEQQENVLLEIDVIRLRFLTDSRFEQLEKADSPRYLQLDKSMLVSLRHSLKAFCPIEVHLETSTSSKARHC